MAGTRRRRPALWAATVASLAALAVDPSSSVAELRCLAVAVLCADAVAVLPALAYALLPPVAVALLRARASAREPWSAEHTPCPRK